MGRRFNIYKITSPSGKSYIGMTSSPIKERWRLHVNRALKENRNHPMCNAIRKYGKDAFTVAHIASAHGVEDAAATEITCISQHEGPLYNLSPGGEYDAVYGRKVFWERLRSDPEAYAEYIVKLSAALRALTPEQRKLEVSMRATAEWRKANPKEAYKLAMRGIRAARKATPNTGKNERERQRLADQPLKQRLLWKHKRKRLASKSAQAEVWASRTEDEKGEIFSAISSTLKARYEKDGVFKSKNESQLKTARDSIDRSVQGPRASAGLKKYWADLKANPEKYKAVMDAKREKLRKKT